MNEKKRKTGTKGANRERPAGRRRAVRHHGSSFRSPSYPVPCCLSLSITLFFIWRESDILKMQVVDLVERETVHLANTAQQSIGVDELSLMAAINDLKKINYIQYASSSTRTISSYSISTAGGSTTSCRPSGDGVDRKLAARSASDDVQVLNVADPQNPGEGSTIFRGPS